MILAAACAAFAVVFACQAAAFTRLLSQERRAHARERDLLLNQLLHLSGKPWLPAPASEKPAEEIPVRPYLVNPNRIPLDG